MYFFSLIGVWQDMQLFSGGQQWYKVGEPMF